MLSWRSRRGSDDSTPSLARWRSLPLSLSRSTPRLHAVHAASDGVSRTASAQSRSRMPFIVPSFWRSSRVVCGENAPASASAPTPRPLAVEHMLASSGWESGRREQDKPAIPTAAALPPDEACKATPSSAAVDHGRPEDTLPPNQPLADVDSSPKGVMYGYPRPPRPAISERPPSEFNLPAQPLEEAKGPAGSGHTAERLADQEAEKCKNDRPRSALLKLRHPNVLTQKERQTRETLKRSLQERVQESNQLGDMDTLLRMAADKDRMLRQQRESASAAESERAYRQKEEALDELRKRQAANEEEQRARRSSRVEQMVQQSKEQAEDKAQKRDDRMRDALRRLREQENAGKTENSSASGSASARSAGAGDASGAHEKKRNSPHAGSRPQSRATNKPNAPNSEEEHPRAGRAQQREGGKKPDSTRSEARSAGASAGDAEYLVRGLRCRRFCARALSRSLNMALSIAIWQAFEGKARSKAPISFDQVYCVPSYLWRIVLRSSSSRPLAQTPACYMRQVLLCA